jgi:hypothetical protein
MIQSRHHNNAAADTQQPRKQTSEGTRYQQQGDQPKQKVQGFRIHHRFFLKVRGAAARATWCAIVAGKFGFCSILGMIIVVPSQRSMP